ncbi:MAG: septal ring lytic transglycosylase RlpA family protein [Kiloniellales bacterium]
MKMHTRRLHRLRFQAVVPLLLALSACSFPELDFASHTAKQLNTGEAPAVGHYKVGNPYQIAGVWYYPKVDYNYDATGIASWYGPGFHGRQTANGEIFDQNSLSAAHPTLPMPSIVRVTNLENGRAVTVRVNDRGPFKHGRVIDMSRRGAQLLGFEQAGTARVRVQVLEEESLQHAALARNLTVASNGPAAAPMEAVSEVPLAGPDAAMTPTEAQTAAATDARGRPAQRQIEADWPDGRVVQTAVRPSNIYIQAGAFLRRDSATRLSIELNRLARSQVTQAQVGQQHFFRVRVGPIPSVEEADRLLNALIANGHSEARIVVE